MSILPITAAFQSYLTDERHFSRYTARCYGADLRQFVEYLSEEHGLDPTDSAETDELRRRLEPSHTAGAIAKRSLTAIVCEELGVAPGASECPMMCERSIGMPYLVHRCRTSAALERYIASVYQRPGSAT